MNGSHKKSDDAVIVGGGLIGSAIALELARNGLRVSVFDAQAPGREASWASAGILSPAPENPGMICMVPIGKSSLAIYPEFIRRVEEVTGKNAWSRKSPDKTRAFARKELWKPSFPGTREKN